jgi:hypothetical protein
MLKLIGILHDLQPLLGGMLFIVAARWFAEGVLETYESSFLATWRAYELDAAERLSAPPSAHA